MPRRAAGIITSSASASSDGAMVISSAFAVLRLPAPTVDEPYNRHRRLLRARRQRLGHCRAAEQRDDRAPLHSTTSSAIAML
jgi:hypothetical protein